MPVAGDPEQVVEFRLFLAEKLLSEFEVVDSSDQLQQPDIVSGDGLEVTFASFLSFADPPLVYRLVLHLLTLEVIMTSKP